MLFCSWQIKIIIVVRTESFCFHDAPRFGTTAAIAEAYSTLRANPVACTCLPHHRLGWAMAARVLCCEHVRIETLVSGFPTASACFGFFDLKVRLHVTIGDALKFLLFLVSIIVLLPETQTPRRCADAIAWGPWGYQAKTCSYWLGCRKSICYQKPQHQS